MAVNKDKIQELINVLSEKDLELVTDLMERLAFNHYTEFIKVDNEPTTLDDIEAIKKSHEALRQGELINLKDIEDELRS